jgi:Outer membrane protein beta-barrel domain
MKKIFFLTLLLVSQLFAKAQFVNGIGLMGGISYSNQRFITTNPNFTDAKKYVLGYNGDLFIEFFNHKRFRWQTEFQYNQKGSKDEQPTGDLINKLEYGCWNNYLKIRYEMLRIIPFVLIGPRLEYAISQSIESPGFVDKFQTIHGSLAVGAGIEFVTYGQLKFITDFIYNPDITKSYASLPLNAYNNNFELRIGLKLQFGRAKTHCNVPTSIM